MSRPGPSNSSNPLSFKTVPGRNKTQKWSQAKTYNYDGDDWGGYDPYDEYGGYDEPPPPANAPPQQQSQQPTYGQPARRQNSFDGGLDNERRAFSAGYAPPPPPHVEERRASPSSSTGRVSHESGRPSGEYGAKRLREFSNPGQVPAPLSMRGAAPPATIAERPPRKSSLSAASSASEAEPTTAPPKTEKPLPFIRPSDIYKRMNEEKERERKSQESSRPSMDSIQRDAGSPPPIPAQLAGVRGEDSAARLDRRPSLPPVNEASEARVQPATQSNLSPVSDRSMTTEKAFTGFRVDNPVLANALGAGIAPAPAAQSIDGPQADALEREDTRPKLPPVSRISGFGNFGADFLRSGDDDSERSPVSGLAASIAPNEAAASTSASQPPPPDATPIPATRAPIGQDPAADILAERQHGHHVAALGRAAHEDPSGLSSLTASGRDYDPAADILAQRQHNAPVQHLGREAYEDASGLASRNTGPSYDPASDILAERQHDVPAPAVGRIEDEHAGGLSHQPSAGFRSVVNTAFDRQDDDSIPATPISRDNSQTTGTAGVNRSDTNSTSSISPIMSRVPSAATAQQKQRERDAIPPPIAEEPTSPAPGSRVVSDATTIRASSPGQGLARKPAPGHSRNVSSEFSGFEPGYRRSLNTPSPNNSPARTPNVEDTSSRRLSGPLTAHTFSTAEAPDVPPEAPEMPSVSLRPAETPGASRPVSGIADINSAIPVMTRGRSGTDYSLREADLAQYASSSPDKATTSPVIGEAAAFNQEQFLRTHPSVPTSPTLASPSSPAAIGTGFNRAGYGIPRATTPGSGRNSPVTSGGSSRRVKAIVDQYHQIDDASRRNSAISVTSSKSSWSNFKGSTEDLPGLRRKMTGGSSLAPERSESPIDETGGAVPAGQDHVNSPTRPEASRLESFRPHLPGEWVSYAPTPAIEEPPVSSPVALQGDSASRTSKEFGAASPPTPRGAQFPEPEEEIDLTPTTKKMPLRFSDPAAKSGDESVSALASVKSAGDALGAALMNSIGGGHQTRDFAAPKEEPAAPVDVPELRPHRLTGDMYGHNIPILQRNDSEAPSFATASAASSVPPTPPAKDTPLPDTDATARNLEPGPAGRPISSYFSGAEPAPPAPLKFTRHSPSNSADLSTEPRPKYLPSLSTDTHASDFESDRLRKDIVRTLGADKKDEIQRESILEDTEMTEDALDGPANADRVAAGGSALPAAETKPVDARFALPSRAAQSPPQSTSGYQLPNRFSWENKPQTGALYAPMAAVGELQGDEDRASYERPRSSQGLHVINTNVTSDSEPSTAATPAIVVPPTLTVNEPTGAADTGASDSTALNKGPVSPITKSQENLNLAATRSIEGGLSEMAPSPISDNHSFEHSDSHIPSYYAGVTDAPPQDDTLADSAPITSDAIASPNSPITATKPSSSTRVPPFREILAIKSTPDRIRAYADTRSSFADMNTGLNDWVSNMLTQHPEHADLAKQGPNTPMNTLPRTGTAHKHSQSILKITKQFTSHDASSSGSPSGGEGRKVSNPPASSSTGGGEGLAGKVDVKEMQAKGKDLMKSAGAGAKGLFAKGRSRFANRGGEKDT